MFSRSKATKYTHETLKNYMKMYFSSTEIQTFSEANV